MDRENAIKTIMQIASKMAEKYGFTEMTIGKDRQKGIWGEGFTEFLESKYGDCSTIIRWTRPNKDDREYVEFCYRFADPTICIKFYEGDVQTMANLEFHDYRYKDMGEVYEEDTAFYKKGSPKLTRVDIPMELNEVMLWNPNVARFYAQEMEEMWDEANKEKKDEKMKASLSTQTEEQLVLLAGSLRDVANDIFRQIRTGEVWLHDLDTWLKLEKILNE